MGKYNDFIKPLKPKGTMHKMEGVYGCQSCDENVNMAYFDEHKGRLFWFCSEGHESEIKIDV
ncbi:hypothetical protein EBU94_01810 [bacterium]|nr:hypothetical protein [bacterium]